MLTVGVLDLANVNADLAALQSDAANAQWRCSVSPTLVMPTVHEVTTMAGEGKETPLAAYDQGVAVGFAMVRNDSARIRWFLADVDRFHEVLEAMCRYIIDAMQQVPWGIVEGTNNRLQAMLDNPHVEVIEQQVRNGVLYSTAQWIEGS